MLWSPGLHANRATAIRNRMPAAKNRILACLFGMDLQLRTCIELSVLISGLPMPPRASFVIELVLDMTLTICITTEIQRNPQGLD